MEKHTPGPWKSTTYCGYCDVMSETNGICRIVAETFGPSINSNGYPHPETQIANGRLIAAAPELLDALRWVVECADPTMERGDEEYFDYADLYHAIDRARAAIQKATGEPFYSAGDCQGCGKPLDENGMCCSRCWVDKGGE